MLNTQCLAVSCDLLGDAFFILTSTNYLMPQVLATLLCWTGLPVHMFTAVSSPFWTGTYLSAWCPTPLDKNHCHSDIWSMEEKGLLDLDISRPRLCSPWTVSIKNGNPQAASRALEPGARPWGPFEPASRYPYKRQGWRPAALPTKTSKVLLSKSSLWLTFIRCLALWIRYNQPKQKIKSTASLPHFSPHKIYLKNNDLHSENVYVCVDLRVAGLFEGAPHQSVPPVPRQKPNTELPWLELPCEAFPLAASWLAFTRGPPGWRFHPGFSWLESTTGLPQPPTSLSRWPG